MKFNLRNYHTVIFDFDGIFTDNTVIVNEKGEEAVRCSRADGLGIQYLKQSKKLGWHTLDFFVLSTENNPVVKFRCTKMGIKCFQGIGNKLDFLQNWLKANHPNAISPENGVIYFGNDLNDYEVMKYVGFSVAPKDAHPMIHQIATVTLRLGGGEGFVREGVEYMIALSKLGQGDLHELVSNR
jgi:N-acylneuraminate cytidylyltransferase